MKRLPLYIFVSFFLFLSTSVAPQPIQAATLTVHPGEVAIQDNGLCSLREAIINANDAAQTHPDCPAGTGDDTIIIPAGTYILDDATTPDENFSVTGDLDLRSNITLQGEDAGSTILDGNHTDRVLHVISGAVVIVNDVTIRNGRSPAGADATTGCTFGNCISRGENGSSGGGIANGGTLTLNRVLVIDNQTGDGGNGGDLSCSSPEDSCNTRGGNGGAGAGIHSSGPNLTIHNSVIQHNHSGDGGEAGDVNCTGDAFCIQVPGLQGPGGGIEMRAGNTLTVTLSRITHNSGGQGGGIYCSGVCTITHSAIEDNSATGIAGGLILSHNSPKTVSHTTVANNTSAARGGGIYANLGSVTLSNVTISGNVSGLDGGGLVNIIANTTLNDVTITNNTVDGI